MVKYEAVCGGFGFEERNVDEQRLFEFHNATEMIVTSTSFEQEENKLATWSLRGITNVINKPVGFYGLIAPPVANAPSSECRQFGMPPSFDRCTPPHCRFNQNISRRPSCCCSSAIAGIAIGEKLQNLSPPPSVLFKSNQIFLQYTGDTDAKK